MSGMAERRRAAGNGRDLPVAHRATKPPLKFPAPLERLQSVLINNFGFRPIPVIDAAKIQKF